MVFGSSTNSIPTVAWNRFEPSVYAVERGAILQAQSSKCKAVVSATAYLVAPQAFNTAKVIEAKFEFLNPQALQDGHDATTQQPEFPPLMGVIFGFKNGNATDDVNNDTLNYSVNCKFKPEGLALLGTNSTAILRAKTAKQFESSSFSVTVRLDVQARTADATLNFDGAGYGFGVVALSEDATKNFSAIGVTMVNQSTGMTPGVSLVPPYGIASIKLKRFAMSILAQSGALHRTSLFAVSAMAVSCRDISSWSALSRRTAAVSPRA